MAAGASGGLSRAGRGATAVRAATWLGGRLLLLAATVIGAACLMHVALTPARGDGSVLHAIARLPSYLWTTFVHHDLGLSGSFSSQPVDRMLRERLPVDASLLLGGMAIGIAAGIAAGAACATRPGSRGDRALWAASAFGLSAPVYWVALMLVYLVSPNVGGPLHLSFASDVDSYRPLTQDPVAWLRSLWVPWLVVALPLAAATLRMTRAAMSETLREDFIRTAHGNGLWPRSILWRHALRPAAAPVLALGSASAALAVTNVGLVETSFSIPGTFELVRYALRASDLGLIEGMTIEGAFFVALLAMVADGAHRWLDPRLRGG